LDEEGTLQARYVGNLLANLDVQVEQIISSPLTRARQTASLVANELAFESTVQIDDALRPEAEFDQFQAMLARYKKYDAIMVVGHNPSLNEFLSKSISGGTGAAQIDFKKGAVAKVEMNGRTGTMQWLVTPKIPRTLQSGLKTSSRPKTSRK
ncbi:MAG: histidine phosphatase family protein, partial [Candidatus Angelobacter sp.]